MGTLTSVNPIDVVIVDATGAPVTAANPSTIQGNVASGVADAGNPVKVGGRFNSASPTVTDGQRVDWQMSAVGDGSVSVQGTSLAPGDGNSNTALIMTNKAGTAVKILNWAQVYNGTTWDKQRSVGGGDAGSTGITAAGGYVFNGTTWDRQRVGAYQLAQTAITASSGNVANASAVATLAGVASKTTYITGFEVTAAGATAALAVSITVTGTITGTLTYTFVFPAGVAVAAQSFVVEFPMPIPASAVNTAIVVTLPAGGAGNTNATVVAHGFQQ